MTGAHLVFFSNCDFRLLIVIWLVMISTIQDWTTPIWELVLIFFKDNNNSKVSQPCRLKEKLVVDRVLDQDFHLEEKRNCRIIKRERRHLFWISCWLIILNYTGGIFREDQKDSSAELAFKYAVYRLNRERTILPNTTLVYDIQYVPRDDSFRTSKKGSPPLLLW